MPGLPSNLVIAATLLTALALLVIGMPLREATPPADRRRLAWLVLLMLPMNALAFHAVRMPLNGWIAPLLADWPRVSPWVQTAYAPLTEEPAKLWPFLLPFFRPSSNRTSLVRDALAIGLGFGIGEAWNVAALISHRPDVAGQPWFAFGGFIGERLMVCVMHAGFTGTALFLWRVRRSPVRGFLAAALLHFAGNAPITLAGMRAFGIDRPAWTLLLVVWVLVYFLAVGSLLSWMLFGGAWLERVFRGMAECPGCGRVYRRPIFRVNLVTHSWERCPLCKRWHLMNAFAPPAAPDDGRPRG